MTLLSGLHYDPATSASRPTTAALAMTAVDTTNLRAVFTAPASGKVLVRLATVIVGATTQPQILLGVLNGTTVVGRHAPVITASNAATTTMVTAETTFAVAGLTPGASLTWDAAYGVELAVASTGIRYGGANDATASTAFGGFSFEVWSA